MPTITIKPTVALHEYVHNNLEAVQFADHEIIPPQEAILNTRQHNWYTKYVKHIRDASSTPAAIAKVAIFFFLGLSIVGIPLVYLFTKEVKHIHKDEKITETAIEKLDLSNQQWNQRVTILQGFGIHNFKDVPILDLQKRTGDTGYLDFLSSDELSAPIMKGVDEAGRPFITMKIIDTQINENFAITVFQRYTNQSCWTHGIRRDNDLSNQLSTRITEKDIQIFHQIIQGSHPRFRLA